MDKLDRYRQAIQNLLETYAHLGTDPEDGVDTQLIFDPVRDHYQLFHVGWIGDYRIYGSILHFDIKDEKVWIQHNGTENDVGQELHDLGVPKTDIVIGFHSPFKRQFTEYAVG
ncbi:XisI protein [Roseofilum reptotaenium CS-1145]|uniref:XisI protein n=1 Tax=Roseofilum reptotaenium AO1-A TaxID=1925591 RepID=A0A1L9QVV7_9CYAN|nr:XisI protein [Roseofilum reptotaenium]MDB9518117.1 XisI protein [Roseofilum reptotaenium CS-1145]OJJ26808.1 XisI protein [Roseofilum reptotaenium AO1-A]